MNIGIIGAGNLGAGLTKHLLQKGHTVMLSFSKDLAKLRAAADSLGAKAGTPAEAAGFGTSLFSGPRGRPLLKPLDMPERFPATRSFGTARTRSSRI